VKAYLFLAFVLTFSSACDTSKLPLLWKTYTHPTYRFSVRVPRTWKAEQDSLLGAAYIFRAPDSKSSFRPNLTVVVQTMESALTLDQLTQRSAQQLDLLFKQFRLLGQMNTELGSLKAREIRGRYLAEEGPRLIRTFITIDRGIQYVLTFACQEEQEGQYVSLLEGVRKSFSTNI
jgi:hypothetical protein